jgi:hypothetical protein
MGRLPDIAMRFAASLVATLVLLTVFGLAGCASRGAPHDVPVHRDELETELTDPRLLQRLGAESLVLLEVEAYRVTIARSGSDVPIGELYYTVQDGWHLKADNEVMDFVPGKGWVIAEQ